MRLGLLLRLTLKENTRRALLMLDKMGVPLGDGRAPADKGRRIASQRAETTSCTSGFCISTITTGTIYVYNTFERARSKLDAYVLEWWNSTRGRIASEHIDPTPGDPATMTQEQRIETFFEYWQSKGIVESYEIEEYEVRE
jgi:hypothetical protein